MASATRRNLLKAGGAALAGLAGADVARGGVLAAGKVKADAAKDAPDIEAGGAWARPQEQKGNGLNVILLVSDTFRADNLEAYGSRWVQAPYLNKLASQSAIFEHAHPEGLPTIPVRRQLVTGRRVIPLHYYPQHEPVQLPGWHDLFYEDVTLSEVLREAGYVSALIADLPHLQRPDRSFHRGYDYYEWIRGQEIDSYGQAPRKVPDLSGLYPADYLNRPELTKQFARQRNSAFQLFLNQYLANRKRWLQDGESIVEITSKKAIRWLNENHDQGPFFLHVEAFDPHEPWDPPKQFLEQYLKNPGPHSWPEPPYSDTGVPKEGVERLRANYAGEASAVDHWFGQILATVDELGLADNTVVVFLADHGALLGEQGQFVKGPERLRRQVTHIPLLIRTPDKRFASQRVPGFLQVPDVAPTILGRLGLKAPARFTGVDVWPKAPGAAATDRDHVVIAYSWIASVRTHEWNYSAVWNKAKYKGNYPPQLYDLKADPDELHNVIDKHPDVARVLQAKIDAYIASGRNLTNGTFHSQEAS